MVVKSNSLSSSTLSHTDTPLYRHCPFRVWLVATALTQGSSMPYEPCTLRDAALTLEDDYWGQYGSEEDDEQGTAPLTDTQVETENYYDR